MYDFSTVGHIGVLPIDGNGVVSGLQNAGSYVESGFASCCEGRIDSIGNNLLNASSVQQTMSHVMISPNDDPPRPPRLQQVKLEQTVVSDDEPSRPPR